MTPGAEPPGRAPAVMASAADVTPGQVFTGIVTLASSVSWALPPPWSVVATGALSLIQMLLGLTGDVTHPTALESAVTDLENFESGQQLAGYASDFHDFTKNLSDGTSGLTMTADNLDDVGIGYITDFQKFLDKGSTGLPMVHLDCTHLQDKVNAAISGHVGKSDFSSLDDVNEPLNIFVTGVTLWLTGERFSMQLTAAEAGRAETLGDNATFLDKTHSWYSTYNAISNAIVGEDGWLGAVTDAIDNLTTARLALIGQPEHVRGRCRWRSSTRTEATPAPRTCRGGASLTRPSRTSGRTSSPTTSRRPRRTARPRRR